MSLTAAVLFGLVEGFTEFLPISSTGHLLVLADVLNLGQTANTEEAIKSYEIAIQLGAILAVLGLYRHRFLTMIEGIAGKSESGRRVLVGVLIAFVPAAIVGLVGENAIKEHLFGVWPVVCAWAVGGVLVIVFSRRGVLTPRDGTTLEGITARNALLIGLAQVVALWPGTSRSLVTIAAALVVGLSMRAAVEFSFLLGFVTLSAATGYEILKNGHVMIDAFGWFTPLVGLVAAFLAAVISIRWMVGYLEKHDLEIFGWYRIAIAALVTVVASTGVI